MEPTLTEVTNRERRVAARRESFDRRAPRRGDTSRRRSHLRRQTDVLEVLGSPSSSLVLPKSSLARWIRRDLSVN